MKQQIQACVNQAIQTIAETQQVTLSASINFNVEHARDKAHGDYATNAAMVLAKSFKKAPRAIAEALTEELGKQPLFEKVEIAGPGFINFFMADAAKTQVIHEVLNQQAAYGCSVQEQPEKVILEYVSANPTGPLHVGHGRGAAIGASLASLLKTQGYQVHQEYYVNDAGRQMDILAASVYLRYLQQFNIEIAFPSNGYRGDYVIDIAKALKAENADKYLCDVEALLANLPADEPNGGDKELYIDALIANCKSVLGLSDFNVIHGYGLNNVLDDIRQDLQEFGVEFDQYFSERSLFDNGDIDKGIAALSKADTTFEQEGALWFKSTAYNDEKDRVLKRANGVTTYFASDVAYHWNKYDRQFDHVINIFGADHHGYVARVKAAAHALGFDESAIDVLLVQFAILYRGKEKVPMSTRSGEFVTLRQLRDEVGKDAARFFYVMRKSNQHMDFDLELAKSKSNENPVYYVQYAHARVASVFNTLAEKAYPFEQDLGLSALSLLDNEHEQQLLNQLQKYPEMLSLAARNKEPHQVAYYVRELANQFHTYYNAHQFIVEDPKLRNARLCLIKAIKQVLSNGLSILGVSAPEQM